MTNDRVKTGQGAPIIFWEIVSAMREEGKIEH